MQAIYRQYNSSTQSKCVDGSPPFARPFAWMLATCVVRRRLLCRQVAQHLYAVLQVGNLLLLVLS